MCLAVPGRITAIRGMEAEVLVGETTRKAGVQLCQEAREGDYVLIKTGLVVQILPETEALELMEFFAEMVALLGEEDDEPVDAPPRRA